VEIADNNVLSSPNIRWLIAVAIIAELLSYVFFRITARRASSAVERASRLIQ
jgi:hypothetical protein